ncbi:hypothetical protein IE4872_PC00117 (plasmid) [Rhizobium gallicum]|uniref:Uncharacterized protein n=1 Tax=Rhizobium gallicum TaxID=56730 RepID=A0A1L5NQK4_9HYPH|nr:hypothetical protein [Rhizobium gallicum]APO70148.1 hypothetical protein IE4872_PC00117 [Rhizobium gallicum]
MDEAQGDGWAEIQPDGIINGQICLDGYDDADLFNNLLERSLTPWVANAGSFSVRTKRRLLMSDLDFLKLYADAATLRIDVLVSHLECSTALERALQDYLENFLSQFIAYTRSALAAERRFIFNTDPARVAELGEDRWNHRENYGLYWCEAGAMISGITSLGKWRAFAACSARSKGNSAFLLTRWIWTSPRRKRP